MVPWTFPTFILEFMIFYGPKLKLSVSFDFSTSIWYWMWAIYSSKKAPSYFPTVFKISSCSLNAFCLSNDSCFWPYKENASNHSEKFHISKETSTSFTSVFRILHLESMKCKNSLLIILSLSFDFERATDASDSRNWRIFIIIQKTDKGKSRLIY